MYKRILVPLDGLSPVEAGVLCAQNRAKPTRANIVLFITPPKANCEFSFSNPSFASCFTDGREAKTHIYPNAISNGVEGEGIKPLFSCAKVHEQKPFWRSQTRRQSI